MISDPPTVYEQLTPEEAAHIDGICDRFEQAWRKARAGGPVPSLESYVGTGNGPAREILFRELTAVDGACRERYGLADRPENTNSATLPTHIQVPKGQSPDWPIVPGLELMEVLGSGGMGVVYKARQATLDRDVAVKFLRDAHRADSEQRERFLQEARAVARLRHPNLVQVYEFGELPVPSGITSQPYLVLEYVSGGSLADIVRGSPQPPGEAARLVETLADAIDYAHQQGVIHRDLKPANVLLQNAECRMQNAESAQIASDKSAYCNLHSAIPKVTDFGLAKLLAGSDLTQSGHVLGTPSYMAPEQATGKSAPITAAVDVYGLGAILYEVLTGRPPFVSETVDATIWQVLRDDPLSPRRLQPTVPRDLETICLKCLRKEPGRRYATAQDLADDLRRFRAGEPVRARPVGTSERLVRWCGRHPGVAGLLAALVLVFLAGSTGVIWQWHSATQERDMARYETRRAEYHLRIARERVDSLNRLGHQLLQQPGRYSAGQAVLEEALAFYKDLLPEEGNDPGLRHEAAYLYGQLASIYLTLDQTDKAGVAFNDQARLLATLFKENPADKGLRLELADSQRWRGNTLRRLGKTSAALEAYDTAAVLHQGLQREFPKEPRYQLALANTLLNRASMLPSQDRADELEPLYREILGLERSAIEAQPDNPGFKAELALALEDQGLFFRDTGRHSQAEAAVREALEIHRKLLAGKHTKGFIERSTARTLVVLGRVLIGAGRPQEAEQPYQEATKLLEPLLEGLPESGLCRTDLAQVLTRLANLQKDAGRGPEAVENRRRALHHYETLRADFPENPRHERALGQRYVELIHLLGDLGRQSEAAETYRKLLEMNSEDGEVNNNRAWFLATDPEPRWQDPTLAVRLARKAVAAQRLDGNSRNTLGVALYRTGDDKAAITELESAMRLRSNEASFDWFFLAMAHWRLGNRTEARKCFDQAVEWMDKNKPNDDELRRFRAEAEGVLAEAGKR
jgi:serine/threonine protein kinase/tetratricopeptide (TPR) repeat protein